MQAPLRVDVPICCRFMSSLQDHLQRLFDPTPDRGLLDAQGRTRALVLELLAPADGALLVALWRSVQADLGWPAPALAVSGAGLQVWFALTERLSLDEARAVLQTVLCRYLVEIPADRVVLWPSAAGHARLPGVALAVGERWSAFVVPELAPLFGESPWLDVAPGDDGQAMLLEGMATLGPSLLQALYAAEPPAGGSTIVDQDVQTDPRRFLQQVMSDPAVPMALRIEAAKALLTH